MIKCSICWEEKCPHFQLIIIVNEKIIKKTFSKDIIKKTNETFIKCRCTYVFQYYPYAPSEILTCKCGFKLLSSNKTINNSDMAIHFGPPRDKCNRCEFTGIIENNTFSQCINCAGTGGINCTDCANLGYTLINHSSANYTTDCIVTKCQKCSGTGWIDKCSVCLAHKAIISGKIKVLCTNCHITNV